MVVNPIHVDDLAQLHTQIAGVCAELGWKPPRWLQTGTANLLARNLAIVLDDPARATRIALSGNNRAVDVGRVFLDDRGHRLIL